MYGLMVDTESSNQATLAPLQKQSEVHFERKGGRNWHIGEVQVPVLPSLPAIGFRCNVCSLLLTPHC